MSQTIEAIYENGLFRPVTPVSLDEGTRVAVTLPTDAGLEPQRPLAELLDEIAALPAEGADDGFSGADHDQILYPKQ